MRSRKYLAAVAGLILTASVAFTQEKIAVFAYTGFAFPEENRTRGGIEPGGGISLPLFRRFSLSLEFSSWQNKTLRSASKPVSGTVTITPILVSLLFDFPRTEFCIPYVFAGGGFAFARPESVSSASLPGATINEDVQNGLGLYVGAGARIPLSDSLHFLTEASYFRRSAPAKLACEDASPGVLADGIRVSLRTVLLRVGFKYFF